MSGAELRIDWPCSERSPCRAASDGDPGSSRRRSTGRSSRGLSRAWSETSSKTPARRPPARVRLAPGRHQQVSPRLSALESRYEPSEPKRLKPIEMREIIQLWHRANPSGVSNLVSAAWTQKQAHFWSDVCVLAEARSCRPPRRPCDRPGEPNEPKMVKKIRISNIGHSSRSANPEVSSRLFSKTYVRKEVVFGLM